MISYYGELTRGLFFSLIAALERYLDVRFPCGKRVAFYSLYVFARTTGVPGPLGGAGLSDWCWLAGGYTTQHMIIRQYGGTS